MQLITHVQHHKQVLPFIHTIAHISSPSFDQLSIQQEYKGNCIHVYLHGSSLSSSILHASMNIGQTIGYQQCSAVRRHTMYTVSSTSVMNSLMQAADNRICL